MSVYSLWFALSRRRPDGNRPYHPTGHTESQRLKDIEALRVLFSRLKSDSQAIRFDPPQTQAEEQFALFKRLIEEKSQI